MASLNSWINTQIALHNIRVSPRLPIDERIKRFYMSYAAQQGITLDAEDADLCSILVHMRHGEGMDAGDILTSLIQIDNESESEPSQTNQSHHSRQTDIRKCRRSPRLNK